MRVTFLHPRDSDSYPADVEEDTTGQTCVDKLVNDKFLDVEPKDRPYSLTLERTQKQILKPMTMNEADVRDNDTIAILQQERGA